MTVRDAPISRTLVDEALPWLRAIAGIAFVAYSANSTILIGAADLLRFFDSTRLITIGYWPDAYWYSAIVAVILFVGEVATSEKYPKTYKLFLIPDAFYTARGIFAGLSSALSLLAASFVGENEAAAIIGVVLAFPVSVWIGYLIAKWGEVLLFGKRRTRISRKDE